jgi:hypothetical protein
MYTLLLTVRDYIAAPGNGQLRGVCGKFPTLNDYWNSASIRRD